MRFVAPRKLFRRTLSLWLVCEMSLFYVPALPAAASTRLWPTATRAPVGLAAVISQGAAWLLSQLAPGTDDAAFVSQVVPDLMFVTLPSQVTVTMTNTGTRPWRSGSYTLNSLAGASWGITRVSWPQDIQPGHDVSFQFGIRAPSTEGFYNFQWQMQNDVGQWFGSPSVNVAVQVIPQGPLPPRDLRVTAMSRREVDLRWTPRSTDQNGFYLERRVGDFGAWLPLDNVGAQVTTYPDRTVSPGTTYSYRVRAFYSDGRRSPFSNEATVTTSSAVPPVAGDTILPTETINGNAMVRTPGVASVTSDGTATYSIPLWVPPGRAGIQPNLSLTYSSVVGNGPLGVGWSLSGLSQISRCKKTWAQDGEPKDIQFTTDDRFCLDGQRLVAVSGAYGEDGTEYRTEVDTFVKVVSLTPDKEGPLYFRVFTRDGKTLTYGIPGLELLLERASFSSPPRCAQIKVLLSRVASKPSRPCDSLRYEHMAPMSFAIIA